MARKYRRYLRGSIDHLLSLGTLAGSDLIASDLVDAVEEPVYVSSVKAAYSLDSMTPGTDVGPILCGWAHSDYTDAEIEAWVENQGSWSAGDKVAQEIARRQCKQVGIFDIDELVAGFARINNGATFTTKLGWVLIEGATLKFWCYNMGTAALATTNPNVRAQGHANLWPTA